MAVVTLVTAAAVAMGVGAGAAAAVGAVAATIATTSMYVGLAGLALKIVGTVTKDKTLSKIGTYMGYAGLVGGIVSGGVSTLADMAVEGYAEMSSQALFEQGTAQMIANQSAVGSVGGVTQQQIGEHIAGLGSEPFVQGSSPFSGTTAPTIIGGPLETPLENMGDAVMAGVDTNVDPTASNPALSTESAAASPAQSATEAQAAQAAATETASQSSTVAGQPATDKPYPLNIRDPHGNYHTPASGLFGPQQGVTPPTDPSWWKSIDPSVKAMGGLAVGQTLAGAGQGWFAGQSAEEKLELEKLINTQRQTELERKIKNASYAPRVFTGPTGLLQQGGK